MKVFYRVFLIIWYLWINCGIHYVQKKTPTHVFFHISVENVSIYIKFSEYVYDELGILGT